MSVKKKITVPRDIKIFLLANVLAIQENLLPHLKTYSSDSPLYL